MCIRYLGVLLDKHLEIKNSPSTARVLFLLGVIVERIVVVSPGTIVVVIQKPSVGGMPDLQICCDSKHQQHHSYDCHRDGCDAA